MPTRFFGEPIKRAEDPRLLTGRGRYVDDIDLPGQLHVAFLRSPLAHARIRSVDVSAAREMPGVVAVWTYDDIGPCQRRMPLLIPHPDLTHPYTRYPLAKDEVNHVGEPVAMVIAESRYAAEDALEAIVVEWEELPPVVDIERAIRPGALLVHEELGTNVAAHYVGIVGDPERAFAQAAHVFRERLVIERSAGMPIETRAVLAVWKDDEDLLEVWDTTQAPIVIRNALASLFGLAPTQVRVIAPDVGGGFGCKIMVYPEEVLVPYAALVLKRPIKWTEDRLEHFVGTNHERLQIHDAEIAVDGEGRILGIRDRFLHDAGAYTPYGIIVPIITACQLPGPYKVPNYHVEFRAVYSNTVPVSPYRGAGRPHACFVMERLLDRVADELGLDRAEVRRRNFIQPHEFPYDVGLIFQDGAPTRYDSGNYPGMLDLLLERMDYRRLVEEELPRLRAEGRSVGVGIACYVEGTGIGPYEGATVRVEPTGQVYVATGMPQQGQAHKTVLAQIVAEELQVPLESVQVVEGDTAHFQFGSGTYASRSAVVCGSAVALAAKKVREQGLALAAEELEVAVEDLVVEDGRVYVRGVPERGFTWAQIAQLANPLRYAYAGDLVVRPRPWTGPALPPGRQPALEATEYYSPPHATWASGAVGALVEVDVETGQLRFLRLWVVHDCGKMINPLVVEGQVHGGIAQGIGGAFYEKLHYDENGQLLNASFMDFLMPTTMEIPRMEIAHQETPSPLNPLGVKGVGEAGAIPMPAVVAAAVEDALRPFGVRITRMPLDPDQIWRLTHPAEA
ncbi:MAG: aerobic carbon-monoxide dehydrogenase large subunit [Thermomicrobium sp.]|nr:aerobic carbon-monoxide dehydrogenase large subunit [Thermomicrobium sp.]